MTTRYAVDKDQKKRMLKQVAWAQCKAVFMLACAFLIIGVVLIGVGVGIGTRLWVEGAWLIAGAFFFFFISLSMFLECRRRILHNGGAEGQYELTVEENTTQLREVDSDVSLRYNNGDLKMKLVTADAVYMQFKYAQILCVPRLPEVESALPDYIVRPVDKRDKKQIGILLTAIFIAFALIGVAFGIGFGVIIPKSNLSLYYADEAHYVEYSCVISQVTLDDGRLCFTGEITKTGDPQPLAEQYWFTLVSDDVEPTVLGVNDTVTIKACDKVLPHTTYYPVAALSKEGVEYLSFTKGSKDIAGNVLNKRNT